LLKYTYSEIFRGLKVMLMKLGHLIYRLTPFRGLRQLYFDIYARAVSNRQVVADIDGVRYDLDLGELIDLAMYLGKFEPGVVSVIEKYCQPGMIVLDIGANIGAHALRFGRIVGKSGHVYGFEPTTYAFSKLKRNLELNPQLNVSIVRNALSDITAQNKSISFRSSWLTNGSYKDASCEVDFVKLDDWVQENNVKHVDIIKLDVDGNEFGVLAGGEKLLKSCLPIFFMEMVGPHFADTAKNPFIFLESLGYKFSNIDTGAEYSSAEEMSYLIPVDDVEMTTSINIYAVPGK
jgi:FkbM family methyltransferase